ncbi:MAG: hypothetical protein ACO3P8_12445 [Steroidobacteraceae bacterium]
MDAYPFLLLGHLLLLVFWLGTDIGVFLAARISERDDLGVEARVTVLGLGMVLDRLPRSCLVLIIPSGFLLAQNSGLLALEPAWHVAMWLLAAAWLALLWTGFLTKDQALQGRCMLANLVLNGLMALAAGLGSWWLWAAEQAPAWLALKLSAVAAIFAAGVWLDVQFRPAVAAFGEIATGGATSELNDRYRKAIAPVYLSVLTIYALVLVASGLGVFKPG